jgi:hypothetical protein
MPSAICKADCIYRSANKFKRLPSGRLVLNKGYRKQGRCQSVPEIGEKRACTNFRDWNTDPEIKKLLEMTKQMDEKKTISEEYMRFLQSEEAAELVVR